MVLHITFCMDEWTYMKFFITFDVINLHKVKRSYYQGVITTFNFYYKVYYFCTAYLSTSLVSTFNIRASLFITFDVIYLGHYKKDNQENHVLYMLTRKRRTNILMYPRYTIKRRTIKEIFLLEYRHFSKTFYIAIFELLSFNLEEKTLAKFYWNFFTFHRVLQAWLCSTCFSLS